MLPQRSVSAEKRLTHTYERGFLFVAEEQDIEMLAHAKNRRKCRADFPHKVPIRTTDASDAQRNPKVISGDNLSQVRSLNIPTMHKRLNEPTLQQFLGRAILFA
jgi:hypothetical protein